MRTTGGATSVSVSPARLRTLASPLIVTGTTF